MYPTDYLPTVNNAQTQLLNKFVEGLERTLNTKRTEISLANTWSSDRPDGPGNQDLAKYLKLVRGHLLRTGWPDANPPYPMSRPEVTHITEMHITHWNPS